MSGSEIAERRISVATGLNMFVREAGRDDANPDQPLVLLLHGFPELSYSWRHILPRLAAAGYWAVAPDQRGYGHTTGATLGYDVDLQEFTLASVAADAVALIAALGRRRVTAVIGHDFGSPVAATCALRRPDVFEALVMMSAPSAPASAFP
ncbi:MAG: alpha/beta fold hydrolase, partial [Pseudomonadota bacterium]